MTVVRIMLVLKSLLSTFCPGQLTSSSTGLKDSEVTSCQRVLYFTLTELKADNTQQVVKKGPIKIHRAIDLSPAPVNPLSASHS